MQPLQAPPTPQLVDLQEMEELTSASDDDRASSPLLPQAAQQQGTQSDTNWELALSRRQKQKQKRQDRARELEGQATGPAGIQSPPGSASNAQVNNSPPTTQTAATPDASAANAKSSPGETRRPRRRLPPLPRNDFKIILRPKKGLNIKTLTTHQVSRAVVAACNYHPKCTGNDFIVRIRTGSNIIIASTPHIETAELLRRVSTLAFGGSNHDFNTYVAAPDNTLRGVIHGLDPGTSPDELKANLRVRTQGVTIHSARMLGTSKTAVITFEGSLVPRYVLYYGGEVACHPYRPTRQVCQVCYQPGHRSDVCPTPDAAVCRQCGILNPTENHPCTPQCKFCGEGHLSGAKECPQRLKTLRRSRTPQRQPPSARRRWFSNDDDSSKTPSRSRSRSQSFPPLPPAGLDQLQPSQPEQRSSRAQPERHATQDQRTGLQKKGSAAPAGRPAAPPPDRAAKVSWSTVAKTPVAPRSNPPPTLQYEALAQENQQLKKELSQLKAEHAREMAELRALITQAATPPLHPTHQAPPCADPPASPQEPPITYTVLHEMLRELTKQLTQQQQNQHHQLTQSFSAQLSQLGTRIADVETHLEARFAEIGGSLRKKRTPTPTSNPSIQLNPVTPAQTATGPGVILKAPQLTLPPTSRN